MMKGCFWTSWVASAGDGDGDGDDDDFDYAESPVLVISDQYSARSPSYIYSLHAAQYDEDDEDDSEDGDDDFW